MLKSLVYCDQHLRHESPEKRAGTLNPGSKAGTLWRSTSTEGKVCTEVGCKAWMNVMKSAEPVNSHLSGCHLCL